MSRYRNTDAEFARQELEAYEDYKNKLEEAADRRAVDGFLEPVYQQGDLVGHKRKYSDTLMLARLKRLDPEYREKSAGAGGSGPTQINIYLPDNGRALEPVEVEVVEVPPQLPKAEEPPD